VKNQVLPDTETSKHRHPDSTKGYINLLPSHILKVIAFPGISRSEENTRKNDNIRTAQHPKQLQTQDRSKECFTCRQMSFEGPADQRVVTTSTQYICDEYQRECRVRYYLRTQQIHPKITAPKRRRNNNKRNKNWLRYTLLVSLL